MSIIFASDKIRRNASFGIGLGKNQTDRFPIGPMAHERAFYNGLSLALDGIEADAPSGYTAFESEAFEAGQEQGFRELDQDRLEWCDACDRQTQQLRESLEEQEVAEMGSQIGHDDTADGREDGPSHGFASDLYDAIGGTVMAIIADEDDATTPAGSDTIEVVDEVGNISTVAVPAFVLAKCPRLRKTVETRHTRAVARAKAKRAAKGQVA